MVHNICIKSFCNMTGTNVNFTNLPLKIKFWNLKWDLDNGIEVRGKCKKILKCHSSHKKKRISGFKLTKRGSNEENSLFIMFMWSTL